MENRNEYRDMWVYTEQRQGAVTPVVYELLDEGKKVAEKTGSELCAFPIGSNVASLASELVEYDAGKVYLAESPLLEYYTTDGYTKVLSDAIKEYESEVMLYGATHIGRDLAPGIATRVNTGLTAGCTKLEVDPEDKKLMQTRLAFGGNLMATIVCPDYRPQMSTVRPGVMEEATRSSDNRDSIIQIDMQLEPADIRTEIIEIVGHKKDMVSLVDANFIVSGEKGLGCADGFAILQQLAEVLGGTVGTSRAATDTGWIDHANQVGQMGTTVRPAIYFACGISGAIQHLAGMSESDIIIAVNKNPMAPVFDITDYDIVGDINEMAPMLIEAFTQYNEEKGFT